MVSILGSLQRRPAPSSPGGSRGAASRRPLCHVPTPLFTTQFSSSVRLVAVQGTVSQGPRSPYEPDTPHPLAGVVAAGPQGAEGNGNGSNGAPNGALTKADYAKFVHFFRQAGPYIEGHRGRTFVVVVPGNVSSNRALFQSVISDVSLLHGLGCQLVLVIGTQYQIDQLLKEKGVTPKYVGGYRITDRDALKFAIEAAGQVRTQCEQYMSRGPAIPMFRRHTKGDREIHFEPAMRVVSGNYVAAKRRGVIDGVDFGFTGEVRFTLKDDIKRQLEGGNIVLLNNLGYTAAGEVLNCNTFDVGLHAAVELAADKLFFMHLDETSELNLPAWLPLSEAQKMLLDKLQHAVSSTQLDQLKAVMQDPSLAAAAAVAANQDQQQQQQQQASLPPVPVASGYAPAAAQVPNSPIDAINTPISQAQLRMYSAMRKEDLVVNLDIWSAQGFPAAVSTCVIACSKGIKRAHLVDARIDGGLLLELYSRDGVGTMISADFYEGIRKARPGDLDGVEALLAPLVKAGILVGRSREELAELLNSCTVIERDNKILGCAVLLDLGMSPDGVPVAEVGAFCVDNAYRGSGRGDSLLDYVEQDARTRGIRRLVLLTTRTADWFEQRDFRWQGAAYQSDLLPESRRARINPARNSQLYVKNLEAPEANMPLPGKRVGF